MVGAGNGDSCPTTGDASTCADGCCSFTSGDESLWTDSPGNARIEAEKVWTVSSTLKSSGSVVRDLAADALNNDEPLEHDSRLQTFLVDSSFADDWPDGKLAHVLGEFVLG